MKKSNIVDILVTKGDKISELNNDKEYTQPNEITRLVNEKTFTEEQLLALADGSLKIFAEIYASKGCIGGCTFDENGNLKVSNLNIEGTISATKLDVESIVATGKSFIEELESHKVTVTYTATDYLYEIFQCSTTIKGNCITTKYPIYSTRPTQPGEATSYFVVTSRFYMNNIEWVSGISFTGIAGTGGKYYLANATTLSMNNEMLVSGYPDVHSWEEEIF